MIKICKFFTCGCIDNCAFRGGQQILEFQILMCVNVSVYVSLCECLCVLVSVILCV